MKKCAYCGEILGSPFHFKTDEHIIPDSLLKLYQILVFIINLVLLIIEE